MPERKSHVKSRLGCQQCKSRRVKCDEVRPACGNCKRRQESCSYQNPKVYNTPSPVSNGLDQSNGISNNIQKKQLELMHHYATSTWSTQAVSPAIIRSLDGQSQQVDVPRLALKHDYLLDTIFALSALHLAFLRPDESRSYIADATKYHSRALASCRQSLQTLAATECEAMYHCSAKLGVVALAFHSVDHETARMTKPTETIIQLSALWRGTGSIIQAALELVDPQTHFEVFPRPDWDMRSGSLLGSQSQIHLERLRQKITMPKPKDADDDVNVLHQEETEVYLEALENLQGLLDACTLEQSRILAWIVGAPIKFFDYVTADQPLAKAIILLYSPIWCHMDQYWWAHNFGRRIFEELASDVAAIDDEMAEMTNWIDEWTRNSNELAPIADAHSEHTPSMTSTTTVTTNGHTSRRTSTFDGV